MNIVDFFIISVLFYILANIKNDSTHILILRMLVCSFIIIYYFRYLKYNKIENFVKCYTGHEQATASESYNNINKSWCKFTGIPDAPERKSMRKYPDSIYNITPKLDSGIEYDLMKKYVETDVKFNTDLENNHAIFDAKDTPGFIDKNIQYEKDKPKFINLNIGRDNTLNPDSPMLSKYGMFDHSLQETSKLSKIYKINDVKMDFYKPFMGKYSIFDDIKEHQTEEETVEEETIEGFNSCKLHYIDDNIVDEEDTCPLDIKYTPEDKHYHDKETYNTKASITKKNLVNSKDYSDVTTPVLLYFVNNENKRREIQDKSEFNEFVKPILEKKIAVVVINCYNKNDTSFGGLFYRINFMIQHFKKYCDEYGFLKRKVAIMGSNIMGLICYILTYYTRENIKKLEGLLNIHSPFYRENPRPSVLVFNNPIISLDLCTRLKILNNTEYVDDLDNIYSEVMNNECKDKLTNTYKLSKQT